MGIPVDPAQIQEWIRKGLVDPAQLESAKPPVIQPTTPRPPKTTTTNPPPPLEDFPHCLSLSFFLPLRIISETNRRDHWTVKHKRKKIIKTIVRDYLALIAVPKTMPCRVTFTRFGPSELDDDNLGDAFKYARDMVAEWMGVDDKDKRYTWRYRSEHSSDMKAQIIIEFLDSNGGK